MPAAPAHPVPGPDPVPPAGRPAGFLRRLAALFYDGLLLLSVLLAAAFLALLVTGGEAVPARQPVFRAYLLLVGFLYFSVPWVRTGQTLGLKAWRLRVERRDGRPLTWRDATLRFAAGLLAVLPLGLGVLWVLVDRERLAWHDRLSGTRAVRLPPQRGRS